MPATMGHPAAPPVPSLRSSDFTKVTAKLPHDALDAIDGEEFADDAGFSMLVAYWSEIAAAVSGSPIGVGDSSPNWSR